MPRGKTLEERIHYLKTTRHVLLTKGGVLNEAELKWIEHIEEELAKYGIIFPKDEQ